MRKLIYLAVLLLSAVSLYSQNETFAEKYLDLRKNALESEIQTQTISGKQFISGIKDSINLSKHSKKDKNQVKNLLAKIDKVTFIADSNRPSLDDSTGKALKKLFGEQEEMMSFDLGGVMNVKLLTDGNSNIKDFTIFFEIGEQSNMFGDSINSIAKSFNSTSTISLNIANMPIKLEGENVCAILNLTFSKPVSEDEILQLVKNAQIKSPESTNNVVSEDVVSTDKDIIAMFQINHNGKVLYFKGIESNILDSINNDANHFMYKIFNGTTLTSPSDGSKYSGDIDIPSQVEYNGVLYPVLCIDIKAFEKSEITSVTIPDGVLSIERHAFQVCKNLKNIVIPNSVKTIGIAAFQGCENLETLTLSNNLHYLGDFAFNGCIALTSVNLPNSLKIIGEYAFAVCGFKEFQFNNVKDISSGVLSNCLKLESVTLPGSVTTIYKDCLFNNPVLSTIIVQATEPPFTQDVFFWTKENVTVKVPATSIEKYKSAPVWKDLKLSTQF